MSVDLVVYLQRSTMPTPTSWQQAIHDAAFPVELDVDFDPDSFAGFLPCKVLTFEAGFEYYARPMSPAEAKEVGAPDGADFSILFATHSDLRDFACSAVAAATLAWRSGGRLVDPQTAQYFESEDAMRWAAEQFATLSS